MRIPPTGRKIAVRGILVLTVEHGKGTRGLYVWDAAGLLRAIDLLPVLYERPGWAIQRTAHEADRGLLWMGAEGEYRMMTRPVDNGVGALPARSTSFERFAGAGAILAGASNFLYAIAFFVLKTPCSAGSS